MLIINSTLKIPLSELEFTFVRSEGPGGQNVNKVSSKAVLVWYPERSGHIDPFTLQQLHVKFPSLWNREGALIIKSQKTRDALKNKQDCLNKLRQIILVALIRPKKRIPTKPTYASVLRRLDDKSRTSGKKQGRQKPKSEEE